MTTAHRGQDAAFTVTVRYDGHDVVPEHRCVGGLAVTLAVLQRADPEVVQAQLGRVLYDVLMSWCETQLATEPDADQNDQHELQAEVLPSILAEALQLVESAHRRHESRQ